MGDEPIPPPPLLLSEIDNGSGGGCWDEEDPLSELYLALLRERRQHLDDAPTIAEDDARLIILIYACDAVMCRPAAQGILLIILSTRPRDDEPMRRRPTIVEISIFQLKTKNGYLTLRILVQTFQDCHSLRTASTQS